MREKTYIAKDNARGGYILLIPVYYEHETRPAWRKGTSGTLDECKKALEAAPEYLNATPEENRTNRHYQRATMIFYQDRGQLEKADAIRKQYNL